MNDNLARAASARKVCPFLNTEQAAYFLGLSARTLQNMRWSGHGPKYRRHARHIRYHIDDLEAWSARQPAAAHG